MQANKFLSLIFGVIFLILGIFLYRTNEKPKVVALINVEVGGFVAKPGVYQLPVGSRVSNLIDLAGGLTKEVKNINRVAVLKDGQKINIK